MFVQILFVVCIYYYVRRYSYYNLSINSIAVSMVISKETGDVEIPTVSNTYARISETNVTTNALSCPYVLRQLS